MREVLLICDRTTELPIYTFPMRSDMSHEDHTEVQALCERLGYVCIRLTPHGGIGFTEASDAIEILKKESGDVDIIEDLATKNKKLQETLMRVVNEVETYGLCHPDALEKQGADWRWWSPIHDEAKKLLGYEGSKRD